MTMAEWIAALDRQLQSNRRELLTGNGRVSKLQAIEKAEKEFEAYRAREMQQIDSDFDKAVKAIAKNEGNI